MKKRLIIRPLAEDDLREARQWYEERREGLGDEFLMAARAALRTIQEHPERQTVYYRDIRRIMTRRFPYKIFYLIETDRVIVFRILHTGREHQRLLDR